MKLGLCEFNALLSSPKQIYPTTRLTRPRFSHFVLKTIIANTKTQTTSAFVTRKTIAQRLGVPTISIDKLILQGVRSEGKSGLIEGKHYCKLDPAENNSSKFLYDPYEILKAAWSNFKYD